MSERLEPCRKCGLPARLELRLEGCCSSCGNEDYLYMAQCTNDECGDHWFTDPDEAARNWNSENGYPDWVHVLADAAESNLGHIKAAYKGYEFMTPSAEIEKALAAYRKATGKEE